MSALSIGDAFFARGLFKEAQEEYERVGVELADHFVEGRHDALEHGVQVLDVLQVVVDELGDFGFHRVDDFVEVVEHGADHAHCT